MADRLREDSESAKLDSAMKTKTHKLASAIVDACLPTGQVRPIEGAAPVELRRQGRGGG